MASPGRPNGIESNPCKLEIIRALLADRTLSSISAEFRVSESALNRFRREKLKRYLAMGDRAMLAEQQLVQNQQAKSVQAARDYVMEDVQRTRSTAWSLIEAMNKGLPENGVLDCDAKASAALLREIRSNAELQARLEGRLQERASTQVNVVVLTSHPGSGDAPQVAVSHAGPTLRIEPASPTEETIDAELVEIPPGA